MLRKSSKCIAAFLLAVFACSIGTAEDWGTFKGQFVFGGDAPAAAPINVTKDTEVCANKDLLDESLVVDEKSKGIANIVIYMYRKSSAPAPPMHESYAKMAETKVAFDNKACRFTPRVAAMLTSQTLVIGNKDSVGHNTKVDSLANAQLNPLVPASGEMEVKMPEVERLPVSVSCSIHPWMKGYLLVKDDPYFAVTDKDGKFEIKNVPAGEWTYQFWHEKSGYVDNVVVGDAPTKWKKGRLKVKVTADGNDLGKVVVPPSTFED